MENQALIEKINALPPALQNEVNDFADFLLEKYGAIDSQEGFEKHREIIEKRVKEYKEHKNEMIPARDVSKAIKEKYGWK